MQSPFAAVERAPLILMFGPLADRVAALLRVRPSLICKLTFAPREAIHAIAAFLYLAPEARETDIDVASLIDTSDPRELLARALPGCPVRLYRALDTAGNIVQPRSFYERLDTICRSTLAADLLAGPLSGERLGFYDAIRTMDPLVVEFRSTLGESLYVANAVHTLGVPRRNHDVLVQCDLSLPKNAGMNGLLRRLLHSVDALHAPEPPFTIPPPLSLVGSIDELRRVAGIYRNCLREIGHYSAALWFDLVEGNMVFLTSEGPSVLIALRKVGWNLWLFEQMEGPRDRPVTSECDEGPAETVRRQPRNYASVTRIEEAGRDDGQATRTRRLQHRRRSSR
jgi:hypothetical protein